MDAATPLYSIDDMYGKLPISDEEFEAIVTRSLQPRGPDMLYDAIAAAGLTGAHRVLDIGCRTAAYACELARRFGCSVLAVDPIAHQIEQAQANIVQAELAGKVEAVEGRIEAIPTDDASFDFIWCRDMLNHVPDVRLAFRECARVLKPSGIMLIYQTFATDLLAPAEAQRLYPPLAVLAANMSPAYMEAAWQAAGFETLVCDRIGSEWRERWEEEGRGITSGKLLKIARMRRDRERLIAELGEKQYETELADCHWGVYQMLGKLCPTMYIIRRAG